MMHNLAEAYVLRYGERAKRRRWSIDCDEHTPDDLTGRERFHEGQGIPNVGFLNYAERYDTTKGMIRHKIEHTFRVADLSERYANALGMGPDDAAWAWFFGLLHDIGRFEQVRRFGTFVDSQSVDHAELGADILFGDGLIGAFSVEEPAEAWMAMARSRSSACTTS